MNVKRAGWLLFVVLVLAVVLVTANLHWRRAGVAALFGRDAIAYSAPRIEVEVSAGPPQPRISLGEAGIDPAAVQLAVDYAGRRNTRALLIGRGGHIVFEKYWGGANPDTPAKFDGFAPVLTALVFGSAMSDERSLNPDVRLSNYLPEWENDPRGAITVRQLMSRESGLATADSWPWPGTRASSFYTSDRVGEALLAWPLAQGPAKFADVPRVDAELLALVLQRHLQSSYRQLLVSRVWQPIGAGDFSMSATRNACCLRTRLGDWMRIGELLANDGVFEGSPITPAHFVSQLLKPSHPESPVGWFVRVDGAFAAHDVARLESAGKQRLWVVPSLKLVILRVGDEPSPTDGWDEASIPDSIVRGTSGWHPPDVGQKVDPKLFAPH